MSLVQVTLINLLRIAFAENNFFGNYVTWATHYDFVHIAE